MSLVPDQVQVGGFILKTKTPVYKVSPLFMSFSYGTFIVVILSKNRSFYAPGNPCRESRRLNGPGNESLS